MPCLTPALPSRTLICRTACHSGHTQLKPNTKFLLNITTRVQRRVNSAPCFNLRMTREEIGSYLGVKLETVCQRLPRFQKNGMIRVLGRVDPHSRSRRVAQRRRGRWLAFRHDPGQRHPRRNGNAAPGAAVDVQDAAQLVDPLAHAEQTEGVGSRRRIFR